MSELDVRKEGVRGVNARLMSLPANTNERHWIITNPMGQHAIACGLDLPITVEVKGHVGFYAGGMNKQAEIIVHGHAGVGVAENMMSGSVRIKGNASESHMSLGFANKEENSLVQLLHLAQQLAALKDKQVVASR